MVRKPWGSLQPKTVPKNRGPQGRGFWIGPVAGWWDQPRGIPKEGSRSGKNPR